MPVSAARLWLAWHIGARGHWPHHRRLRFPRAIEHRRAHHARLRRARVRSDEQGVHCAAGHAEEGSTACVQV